jgi:hypothetical protein
LTDEEEIGEAERLAFAAADLAASLPDARLSR